MAFGSAEVSKRDAGVNRERRMGVFRGQNGAAGVGSSELVTEVLKRDIEITMR